MSLSDLNIIVEDALYDFILTATGLPTTQIVWAETNKNKIKGQYITIRRVARTRVGRGRRIGYNESGIGIIASDYELAYVITAVRRDNDGQEPMDLLGLVDQALGDGDMLNVFFSSKKIGFQDCSSIADVTIPLDGISFEQRANMNIYFNVTICTDSLVDTGQIDTVNGTLTVTDTGQEEDGVDVPISSPDP